MNDEQLDALIGTARSAWRNPPELDLERGWAAVERRRRGGGRRPSPWARGLRLGSLAAGLLLSFVLGRASVNGAAQPVVAELSPVVAAARIERPIEETATLLLGESVVLLSALPAGESTPAADRRFAAQAEGLLMTTRLLLDARASTNPKLHELLQDLEYVLAQVARLRVSPSREELHLITDALQQQEIVPRIRSIAAGLSAGAD